MFRNVAAAAFRHLARQRALAVVSIGGLALSLAAALLIALQVRASFDYDRWIPEHDTIHRVALGLALGNTQDAPSAGAAAPVAGWIAQDYPQVRAVGRLRAQVLTVQSPVERVEETVHWTDASLFDVLRLPVVAGDAREALSRPDGAVLTSEAARRYFGDAGAVLGRELTVGDAAFRVGAVLQDLPARTHLAFAVLLSPLETMWRAHGDGGALHLELLDDAIRRRHGDLLLQARTLWAFVAVAVLIAALGLAALAAHVAQRRTREIGIRKALGAHPGHIVRLLLAQFARPVLWANLLA